MCLYEGIKTSRLWCCRCVVYHRSLYWAPLRASEYPAWDFLLLISHGWAVTFPGSHRTVFTFRSWLDLLGVVLAFWISILKISKLLQNYLHRVTDITNFEKHLESSLDQTPNYCRNLVIFRSKNMCQKNLSPGLLLWSSLQNQEGQRHAEFHLVGF